MFRIASMDSPSVCKITTSFLRDCLKNSRKFKPNLNAEYNGVKLRKSIKRLIY